jgi:acyl-CoA synthetase (AMP-forming)/AMP-acid ligase II
LEAFCRLRLSHFEVPGRWWLRHDPLPLNDTGKVDKRRLRSAWPA